MPDYGRPIEFGFFLIPNADEYPQLIEQAELAGLEHEHLVPGRERVDERGLPGTGAGRRENNDLAGRAENALQALADFVHEYGERGLRADGGRRAARRFLEAQPPELDEPA